MSKSLKLFAGSAISTVLMLTLSVNFADRLTPEMPAEFDRVAVENDREFHLIARAYADEAKADAPFGLGREALPEEIAAWNLDVSPDGTGLPVGSGDVMTGEEVFADNCAVCHGDFAEGRDNWPKLAGGDGTLADDDPLKTVGSYWPHLSTTWDYVNRSMPFGNAQSLTADEVYAIVAYILYSNYLVEDDFVLSNENFTEIVLPNAEGFIIDDRAETEYAIWSGEPCMENCKESVEITRRATNLDVTPGVDTAEEQAATAPAAEAPAAEEAAAPAAEPAAEPEAVVEAAAPAAIDMDLAGKGEKVFKKCKACHKVGDGAKNGSGPQLNGIVGRAVASADGFKYSGPMVDHGGDWTPERLAAFLANPKGEVKGTKMSFAGLKKEEDVAAVIEYLKTFGQ
ncbi:c-type cytochrome [Donghicola tyrosinivorans]|uniref:Cytochrome c n=1 Tax=Donghicola tyrosinivorans TaxID=1652492 RepID=A0A2T0WJG9_9RHOB|nr:c-type cytochrome [Donghicola tyrosinivorans]PRY86815.1 cytochrome c [Donghicola tyrosinivorans]